MPGCLTKTMSLPLARTGNLDLVGYPSMWLCATARPEVATVSNQ